MNSLLKLFFTFWALETLLVTANDGEVDYFVNLINREVERTNTYRLPTDQSEYKATSDEPSRYKDYDYIVVGAGSTGAVLASRLSEVKENKILLIEAGGFESDFTDIPAMVLHLQRLEYNWNYNTTPQTTSCLASINQACAYPRGKGLGGSSIINGALYVRGNKEDYNSWDRQGNPGWSYKDVLPYFIKSENSNVDGDEGYHGVGGNMNIELHKPDNPQLQAFLKANLELGGHNIDYNGKEQLGASKLHYNTIKGRRVSTAKAFLNPAMKRSNLKVLTHSLVIKILINPKTKTAYGVLFSRGGQLYEVRARKEIIVSAGSIGSPQILMLSGIGPREHLQTLGIPVIQSLSVGENYQDHAAYYGFFVETNYTEPAHSLKDYVENYLNGRGFLTNAINLLAVGFYQTKLAKLPGVPDVEILMIPSNSTSEMFKTALNLDDETYSTIFGGIQPSSTFCLLIMLLHPKSSGKITLQSKDPYVYPLIDSRFLSDPDGLDIETMYEGINLSLDLINTKPFQEINARLVRTHLPACRDYDFPSKEYWYCHLRQLTFHVFHATGTCKMGPDPSKGAVVDSNLRVHGIKNLRVADASIIPEPTSGHPNAPCIMIGEKLSDMIKNNNS